MQKNKRPFFVVFDYEVALFNISISTLLKNIDIDMVIFENIDIDINKAILENIDIDKEILKISIMIGSL